MLKIASWNVNSLKVRLPQVLQWLESARPDILGLQETKLADENFPAAEIEEAGYHVHYSGQKTYNGVALLSKTEASDILTDLPGIEDPQRRVIGATVGGLRVLNLYVPNGQEVGSDKFDYKLHWLGCLSQYVQEQLKHYPKLVVMGDFNIAPDERDVHDPIIWEDHVLFSGPERDAFQGLLSHGLQDTFRLFEQADKSYSWWDYRANAFKRNLGLRIDHILASEPLAEQCRASYVDKEPRKWERPSDHAPVVAEFED